MEENTTNFHFIGQDSTGQASVFKVLSFCETPSIATVPSSRIYCSGYSEAWVSMLVLILQFLIFAPWWQSSCFKIYITIENIYYHWQCYAIFGIVNVWIHVSFIIRGCLAFYTKPTWIKRQGNVNYTWQVQVIY